MNARTKLLVAGLFFSWLRARFEPRPARRMSAAWTLHEAVQMALKQNHMVRGFQK